MPVAAHDPVEAAKIRAPGAKRRPEPTAAQPTQTKQEPRQTAQAPAPSPQPSPPRWRVKATRYASLNGVHSQIHAGSVVGEDTHGPGVVERLRAAGVELEPLP